MTVKGIESLSVVFCAIGSRFHGLSAVRVLCGSRAAMARVS